MDQQVCTVLIYMVKLKKYNLTIVGEDPVSTDIVGAEMLSHKHVLHIAKALERKIGEKPEVEKIKI
ncbi:MAG TPA: hypothetical protein EYP23_02965 [Thermoplasmata archaeon]|nr:hypothetical protein [Thermoplasmata archaeon]